MCGICGIALSRRSDRRLEPRALERMRDVLVHRGPDDEGVFLDGRVGLGHRRLSIVDVAGGHQPMLSEDGSRCIVYNGEVYNHPTLRASLEAQGHQFRTRCDTETVLRAYVQYGRAVPQQLRGMFAFAIWDRQRQELFLARDRFGVKPLYYVVTRDGSLFFASEIKALLAAGAVTPALNVTALPDYLANHAPSGEHTLFEGVRRLPAGSTLRWRDGDVHIESYWDQRFEPAEHGPRSERSLVAEYRERFREAVRLRLMSDVPLGVFLSGGIDSAAITAEMSSLVGGPVQTFSVAFGEREANELAYARMVAERFRCEHHEVVVSPEAFFSSLPRMVWHEDEPIAHPSSIALHFVSRLAADRVKVVLTGEGSDEVLAGYGRYRATLLNVALGRRYERYTPRALRDAVRAVVGRLPRHGPLGRKLVRTPLYLATDLTTLYLDNFAVFSRAQQRELLAPVMRERLAGVDPYAAHREWLQAADGASLLHMLLYIDSKTYLHELLMKQDQMSMAASIESRVPFLDHPLVEFSASLPERLKLHGWKTKYVLREAMRDTLPAPILKRRKLGFPVPIDRWLRGSFRWIIDEYVLGERALRRDLTQPAAVRELVARHERGEDHAERLWSLINLELWHRIFLDGESVEDVAVTRPEATRARPRPSATPSLSLPASA